MSIGIRADLVRELSIGRRGPGRIAQAGGREPSGRRVGGGLKLRSSEARALEERGQRAKCTHAGARVCGARPLSIDTIRVRRRRRFLLARYLSTLLVAGSLIPIITIAACRYHFWLCCLRPRLDGLAKVANSLGQALPGSNSLVCINEW